MTQPPRSRRRRRRYGPPPRRTKNPWASGIYAAVLLVVLLLVLIFIRYFSGSVATAVLAVADLPPAQSEQESVGADGSESDAGDGSGAVVNTADHASNDALILEARNALFGAIYAAQRVALEAVIEIEASDATP